MYSTSAAARPESADSRNAWNNEAFEDQDGVNGDEKAYGKYELNS